MVARWSPKPKVGVRALLALPVPYICIMDQQNQNLKFEFGSSQNRAPIYFGICILIMFSIIGIAPSISRLIGIKYSPYDIPYIMGAVFTVGIILYIKTKSDDKGFILEIKNGYAEFRNRKDMSMKGAYPINQLKITLRHNGNLEDTADAPYHGPELKFENPGISDISILTRAKPYKWKNAQEKFVITGFSSHELDPTQWINLVNALGLKDELIVSDFVVSETGKQKAILIIAIFIIVFLMSITGVILKTLNIQ